MIALQVVVVWCLTVVLGFVNARLFLSDIEPRVQTPPSILGLDLSPALRRELSSPRLHKRDKEYKSSLILDQSWTDVTLLKFQASASVGKNASLGAVSAQIEVICETCYITGLVTAELKIDGDLDIAEVANRTRLEIGDAVHNITSEVRDELIKQTKQDAFDAMHFDLDAIEWPTFSNTNLDLPAFSPFPSTTFTLGFGGLELFLQLKTTVSAFKYQIPLVSRPVPRLGLKLWDEEVGLIFTMDLILTVDAKIDISSGVHIKIADGAALHSKLFGSEASNPVFKGGHFEFLPVTVQATSGGTIHAILRVGLHLGSSVGTKALPLLDDVFSIQGGIEAGLFADVAEFVFQVEETPQDPSCQYMLAQDYTFAIGASAGASVAVSNVTLGPTATTAKPLWSTSLGSACIRHRTSATPTITAAAKRDAADLSTATSTTTYTNVYCAASVPGVCPVSLQTTSKATETLTTAVPSGANVTWPRSNTAAVTTSAFGPNVHSMESRPAFPTSAVVPFIHGLSRREKNIVIGVGVGVGVPLLALLLGGVILLCKRRQRSAPKSGEQEKRELHSFSPASSYEEDMRRQALPSLDHGLRG